MAEIISPDMLVNFGGRYTKDRPNALPTLFLGQTNTLKISLSAMMLLGLDDDIENHVIIQEENQKLYIKKAMTACVNTWPVDRYKDNGLRIAKTSLCKFLRHRFQLRNSDKTYFILKDAKHLGYEITKPSNLIRKEVPNG